MEAVRAFKEVNGLFVIDNPFRAMPEEARAELREQMLFHKKDVDAIFRDLQLPPALFRESFHKTRIVEEYFDGVALRTSRLDQFPLHIFRKKRQFEGLTSKKTSSLNRLDDNVKEKEKALSFPSGQCPCV